VLGAERDALPDLHARALAAGLGVIDIPAVGQQTNDYDDVRAHDGAPRRPTSSTSALPCTARAAPSAG
jgi:hypothetical protein